MTVHTDAQPTDGKLSEAVDPAERAEIARFHAALFPTRLALSRWQHGGDIPHLRHGEASHAAPALRAAWYAAARRDFQAWLDLGGFVQHEEASAPSSPLRLAWSEPREGGARQIGSCT